MEASQTSSNPRLRLRVTAAAETIIRGGHPWVFATSVREQNRPGQAGELAVLYDRKDRFLAIGLFDPASPLRVRILHAGKPVTIDASWWEARLRAALGKREGIFDARTTGYRLIHGESDGWPGLVLDRYGQVLVLKLYTEAWLPRVNEITSLMLKLVPATHLVLRLSRNIHSAAAKLGYSDGQLLHGRDLPDVVVFEENGIRFEAEVLKGQKTGFFLDQRENRRMVETLSAEKTVLNAFSFSGGFSLYAARGGAISVANLDVSAHALAAAERNFKLNEGEAAIAKCRREAIRADAFAWLEQNAARRFGLVILDPPSLAKRESERAGAINAYRKLAANGIRALERGGVLVAASCSAHVSADEFFGVVREAAKTSGRMFREMQTTGHPADHPAGFAEAKYLKAIYLREDGR